MPRRHPLDAERDRLDRDENRARPDRSPGPWLGLALALLCVLVALAASVLWRVGIGGN